MVKVVRLGSALFAAALVAVACAGGADPTTTTATEEPTTTASSLAVTTPTSATLGTTTTTEPPPPIEVIANDYFFEGLPDAVPVGTMLTFFNKSEFEFHEMVVIYMGSDDRSLESIASLNRPGSLGILHTIFVAMPGEAHYDTPIGSGVLDRPGRYVILCEISVGADPEEARARAGVGSPERIEGVPAHYQVGMISEFRVEG